MLDKLPRLPALRLAAYAVAGAASLITPTTAPAQATGQTAQAAATGSAKPPSEALCTAHFDQLSRQIAQRIAETAEASRSPLLAELKNVLRKGAVFVGHAYLESMNEEQGRAELEKGKAELERLSRSERERLAPQCDSLSNNLRKNAPAWQRVIVDRVADRRAQRMVKSAQEPPVQPQLPPQAQQPRDARPAPR
jgi:hypothetical protein